MNKSETIQFIKEQFGVEPDYPWADDNTSAVFRLPNGKWFALIMHIPASRLDLDSDKLIDVINLKCDPDLADTLRNKPNIFPAYHMNKHHWITIILDRNISRDLLQTLIAHSYGMVLKPKKKV